MVSLEERIDPNIIPLQTKPGLRIIARTFEKDDNVKTMYVRFDQFIDDNSSSKPLVEFVCGLMERYGGSMDITATYVDGKGMRQKRIVYVYGKKVEPSLDQKV